MNETRLEYYQYYNFPDGHIFAGHRHTALYEINAVTVGTVELACGDGIYRISEGDAIIIPPNCFHSNRTSGGGAQMLVMELVAEGLPQSPAVIKLGEAERSIVSLLMYDMKNRGLTQSGQVISCSGSAIKLIEILIDYLSGVSEMPRELDGSKSRIYKKAGKYMSENIGRSLSVSDIARAVNVCETSLKNVFSRYTGMGVIEYFNGLKLEESHKRLMLGASCAEVSAALGYSSQAYFSRCFKNYYGISPSKLKPTR